MGLSPEQPTRPKAGEEARGLAERVTRVSLDGEELIQAGTWGMVSPRAAGHVGEDQGWLQPPHFVGTLVFSEGITTFLGTKKVLLVLSVQLQVKSKYDDYILVRAESSLVPAFPLSPGSRFVAAVGDRGGSRVTPVLCHTDVPLPRC